ncbi:hypothetical protein KAR91_65280 [Candidatus Pacearchaeota archaeon]|nr:hypothetical protein [Candidatus Pacearchaeota archaeon]
MKDVFLFRILSSAQGNLGIWVTSDFEARTIELPWKDNRPNVSCIPAGQYSAVYRYSKKFKHHYWIQNVMDRGWILTHNGVWAGDTELGYKTHSHGCVIMGKYHGIYQGQDAVLVSRATLRAFMNFMNREPFNLKIFDSYKKHYGY